MTENHINFSTPCLSRKKMSDKNQSRDKARDQSNADRPLPAVTGSHNNVELICCRIHWYNDIFSSLAVTHPSTNLIRGSSTL